MTSLASGSSYPSGTSLARGITSLTPPQQAELAKFNGQGCDIVIATPGRPADHLENHGFNQHLSLKDYIMGKSQLDQIQKYLPKAPRQTLHFSATISRDVQQISKKQLREGFQYVNTIHEDKRPSHEHCTF
ncbi:uncharacterized protein EV420DRAFT_1473449 [Desarmillaria tabescens]|uniref:DEAD/DEAH-box helicase domain-containing protein n=1 Tax=Armillaria tabescens TaxID=1929756 RepID=A0AA39T7T4_ARMTA|nr:uncharacterized protein EV420DRAFT_1473449 [Desarmillaria tabescens]KAK0470396.1 hypothetical protein EV420DRAFT_1473449 [Desarmillaria tabescens]